MEHENLYSATNTPIICSYKYRLILSASRNQYFNIFTKNKVKFSFISYVPKLYNTDLIAKN